MSFNVSLSGRVWILCDCCGKRYAPRRRMTSLVDVRVWASRRRWEYALVPRRHRGSLSYQVLDYCPGCADAIASGLPTMTRRSRREVVGQLDKEGRARWRARADRVRRNAG